MKKAQYSANKFRIISTKIKYKNQGIIIIEIEEDKNQNLKYNTNNNHHKDNLKMGMYKLDCSTITFNIWIMF